MTEFQIPHFVEKLLELSQAVPVECDEHPYISDQLTSPFIGHVDIDQKKLHERLKHKVLYKKVLDEGEKYGNTLELLLVDDTPVLFFTRGSKWMDSYNIYHISPERTKIYSEYLLSCVVYVKLVNLTYMTDDKLTEKNWFGEYDLFSNPLPINIIEYPI